MKTTNHKKFVSAHIGRKVLIHRFQQKFTEAIADVPMTNLLEVGCGEGFLLAALQKRYPHIPMLGLDYSDVALRAGREIFPQLKLEHGDIYRLAQADKSYDVVVASEVLEHLDRPEEAMKELVRVSKRTLLLSVPNEPWFRLSNLASGNHMKRFGNHPEHVNLWSRRGFGRFVSQFADVELLTGSYPWTIVRARVR